MGWETAGQGIKGMELKHLMRLIQNAETELNMAVEKAKESADIECARGCAFCCYQFIAVSAPEVFRIAMKLKEHHKRKWARNRIEAFNLNMADARNRQEWFDKKLACPFLIDRQCSIYGYRPLPCRGLFSFSRSACENSFYCTGASIAYWHEPLEFLADRQVSIGLCVEDGAYGYRSVPVDLFLALERVLGNVHTWGARFDAGEDIFKAARERALQLVYDDDDESGKQVRAELDRREESRKTVEVTYVGQMEGEPD